MLQGGSSGCSRGDFGDTVCSSSGRSERAGIARGVGTGPTTDLRCADEVPIAPARDLPPETSSAILPRSAFDLAQLQPAALLALLDSPIPHPRCGGGPRS